MKIIKDFNDYELIDADNGKKLEKWGNVLLNRPDPEIIWKSSSKTPLWNKVDAIYNRSKSGGGSWDIRNPKMPESWQVHWKDLTFNLKLMGFKHTGLFPEQAYNWNIIRKKIEKENREVKVLNLFAYTGAHSVVALKSGASVVHVDSSKGMVEWAKENVISSGLQDRSIRFLVDDVKKFVAREIRRGNKYDMIIMDPPSFGRGSNNEIWNIEDDLYNLVSDCTLLLSDNPIMFLINSYTTGLSMNVLENILKLTVYKNFGGNIESDELGIRIKDSNLVLPCGIFARWEKEKLEEEYEEDNNN